MRPLTIYHHLAMGDNMICHGLVRVHAMDRPVYVLARVDYLTTIRHMYRDNERITVLPVADDSEAQARCRIWRANDQDVMKLGYLDEDPTFSDVDYDKHFYRQAGISFNNRWDQFRVGDPEQMFLPPNGPYTVIHDDSRFPLVINDPAVIRIRPERPNLFEWLSVLRGASVIHCIPSSIYLLIDSLRGFPDHIPLYLHKHARPNVTYPEHRKNWIIV